MKRKTLLPESEFAGDLFCPHCGIKLFSWYNGIAAKCIHLVFAYGWNDPDIFISVRFDLAKSFLSALMESIEYHKRIIEDEMVPIAEQYQELFCQAEFLPEDSVASLIASYCWDLPERMFPSLLSKSTIIFKDDRNHSGVHIAIDLADIDRNKV